MKIAYGITALEKSAINGGLDGIGIYTSSVLTELKMINFGKIYPYSFANKGLGQDTTSLGSFKKQLIQSCLINKNFGSEQLIKPDINLFHATDHYIPKFSKIPVVATVHDVIPFTNPEWFTKPQRIYHQLLKKSIFWATHIITVSEFSKQEICRVLGINKDKISVVYNGYDPDWLKISTVAEINKIKQKYQLIKPYIVFVGTIQKRKNLNVLLNAINLLPSSISNSFDLIVIGKPSNHDKEAVNSLNKMVAENKARWLNYVNSHDLKIIVKSAECLVFPSLAEGFGLPIVEALAAGTPVIASNTSATPEIVGGSAILFPSNSSESLCTALMELLTKPELREKLVIAGKKRALDFSWKASAERTQTIYENVLSKKY